MSNKVLAETFVLESSSRGVEPSYYSDFCSALKQMQSYR